MQTGQPSLTAYRVAMLRAAHQIIDTPLLLEDPLALRIVGQKGRDWIDQRRRHFRGRFATHVRLSVVLRSRVAEDQLDAAIESGVRQYVVLGAGLDTSCYRLAARHPEVRSFEVDFPATQAWKQKLLRGAGIAVPPSLAFAAVDFERESWAEALVRAGFDASKPACVSWLGVTYYLTAPAFTATIEVLGRMAPGSSVVFDYFPTYSAMRWPVRLVYWFMARRVARIGEPWVSQFAPGEIPRRLRASGFSGVDEYGAKELTDRFCRSHGFTLHTIARIACATILLASLW